MNRVFLIGRLGKDPELRFTQSNEPVATLSLATDESYKDKSGQKINRAEWHRVVVWGAQAKFCGEYLKKGALVLVEGSLQTRQWEDQQGVKHYQTEVKAQRVQSLTTKSQAQGQPHDGAASPDDDLGPAFPSEPGNMDELPF